jgi:decaprenylphospho-beta-D-erythro-pentofuranosid-2-ulose 2-reductase
MENAFGQPQNVVVFGGTSDIARAIVKKLAATRTSKVILGGRSQDGLDAAAKEAKEFGATSTSTFLFDAEDPKKASKAVAEAFELAAEPIDLVIVAVGLLGNQATESNDPKAALRMANVNYTWPVAAITELRRRMTEQGHGRILVITSVAGIRVRSSMYNYGAAKAGLDRWCLALGESLEGTGVKIQVLRPGVVRTKMTKGLPDAPFTTGPNEVADNVVRGLASGAPIIWSPPILQYVFMVLRHLPAPLWRKIMDR